MVGQTIHIPEVIEPDAALPRDLVALRNFARLLDEALPIPGTRKRIGLDAGLGLIPGVGDAIGALMSAWIIIGALRHRVPTRKIGRMVLNVLIDLGVGSIPLLGDLFDFFFEENMMNLRILMEHRDRRRPPRSTASIALVAGGIVVLLAAAALASFAVLMTIVLWIAGKRL